VSKVEMSEHHSITIAGFKYRTVVNTVDQRRHFIFFQGGGKILTGFLRGGAKYEKMQNKFCRQKPPKVTIFKIRGGANAPPPNDVPAADFKT